MEDKNITTKDLKNFTIKLYWRVGLMSIVMAIVILSIYLWQPKIIMGDTASVAPLIALVLFFTLGGTYCIWKSKKK